MKVIWHLQPAPIRTSNVFIMKRRREAARGRFSVPTLFCFIDGRCLARVRFVLPAPHCTSAQAPGLSSM